MATGFQYDHNLDETLPNYKDIYNIKAQTYQALVSREDYQGNLLPAILAIDPLQGKEIIELGAGTGRITYQIAPLASRLVASDISFQMLRLAKARLSGLGCNFLSCLESHTALPFKDNCADLVIAGWSFCYAAIDAGENWQRDLGQALSETERVLRPLGKLILIESLGTGFESPHRPGILRNYLDFLDEDGFASKWIRTDYLFKGIDEACVLTSFFFGEDPMPMWEGENGVIVPECTGLWWKDY